MKRFPTGIMCTCVVPWDEQGNFIEPLLVDEVREMLKSTPYGPRRLAGGRSPHER